MVKSCGSFPPSDFTTVTVICWPGETWMIVGAKTGAGPEAMYRMSIRSFDEPRASTDEKYTASHGQAEMGTRSPRAGWPISGRTGHEGRGVGVPIAAGMETAADGEATAVGAIVWDARVGASVPVDVGGATPVPPEHPRTAMAAVTATQTGVMRTTDTIDAGRDGGQRLPHAPDP